MRIYKLCPDASEMPCAQFQAITVKPVKWVTHFLGLPSAYRYFTLQSDRDAIALCLKNQYAYLNLKTLYCLRKQKANLTII